MENKADFINGLEENQEFGFEYNGRIYYIEPDVDGIHCREITDGSSNSEQVFKTSEEILNNYYIETQPLKDIIENVSFVL